MVKIPETHTVIIGDNLDHLDSLDQVDLVVTDPPYGINYKSGRQGYCERNGDRKFKTGKKFFTRIANDGSVPFEWLYPCYDLLIDGGAIYIFCHRKGLSTTEFHLKKAGYTIKNMIVLVKSNHGMGDLKGSYAPKYELLLFAVKGRHILRTKSRQKDVWEVPVRYSGAKRKHPNEKPLSWIIPCIENSSEVGDTVLDPFAGSGTVKRACENTNRASISIEIDSQYEDFLRW